MPSRKKALICLGALLVLACLAFAADWLEFPGDFPGRMPHVPIEESKRHNA
ncbi:MAG: hypothetical protein ACYS99_19095 [Planctomycetota bacterium]|jgi:hypothetical protein